MKKMHFENRKLSREFFWFIWFLYALVYMTKTCFTAAMSSIVFEGVMTKSQVGLIAAAFYLFYAPFQIVGGIFADKYDPEKLIVIGLLGGSLANGIIFFNQNYYVVLTVWIFNAIIQFGLWPSIFKIISSQIVRSDKKSATYFISFSSTAGLIFSYAVAALVSKWYYNFALSSVILLVLALILIVLTVIMKPKMKPDRKPQESVEENGSPQEKVSTFKLFLESGFWFMIIISLLQSAVGNSVKTLSATRLMETYSDVSPQIGNILNILILAVSVVSLILAKTFLYPKLIKSAPTGIFAMLVVSLLVSGILLYEKIPIAVAVIAMCLLSGAYSVMWLLINYCNLRFEKFSKSGTAAGYLNMSASLGFVISTYGVTKVADVFDWNAVSWLYLIMIAVSLVSILVILPLWKGFKKKYFAHNTGTLVTENTNRRKKT